MSEKSETRPEKIARLRDEKIDLLRRVAGNQFVIDVNDAKDLYLLVRELEERVEALHSAITGPKLSIDDIIQLTRWPIEDVRKRLQKIRDRA